MDVKGEEFPSMTIDADDIDQALRVPWWALELELTVAL